MARASTRTLLPLDRWAAILGHDPLSFNQVITAAKPQTICAGPWKQWPWQESDKISREDVAQAIAEAERILADYVGYTLLPTWVADERRGTIQPGMPGLLNLSGRNLSGFRNTVQLARGHYISGGVEAKAVIEAGATITYTDEDGDDYFETATVTVNTTVTDVCEIAVYYPGESGRDAWEVRPLRSVTITAGVATIVMWRHQLVLPDLMEALVPEAVDGDNAANFLEDVDVYRHYTDPQQQVQFLWSPIPYWGSCGCGDSACVACTIASQFGCLVGNDYRLGLVHYQPATWDAAAGGFVTAGYAAPRQPDRLRLWYRAGYQDMAQDCPALQMEGTWERAVAYLSLTLLDRNLCGCSNLESLAEHYREDLALASSTPAESRSYRVSGTAARASILDNPFGTTRGAVYAWTRANAEGRKLGRAVHL